MNMVNFVTGASKIVYFSSCGSGSGLGFFFQFWNSNFMPGCTVNSGGFFCIISVPHTCTLGIQFCKFYRFLWISRSLCRLGK